MKTFKVTLLFMIMGTAFLTTRAQNEMDVGRNSFFLEAFGNGFFYSINYDRILIAKDNWKVAGRVGVTYVNNFKSHRREVKGIPLELSYLRGVSNHFLELGIGFSTLYDTYLASTKYVKDIVLISALRIGYRYQKPGGGLFLKGGLMPLGGIVLSSPLNKQINSYDHDSFLYPWAGIGIGYTLKK